MQVPGVANGDPGTLNERGSGLPVAGLGDPAVDHRLVRLLDPGYDAKKGCELFGTGKITHVADFRQQDRGGQFADPLDAGDPLKAFHPLGRDNDQPLRLPDQAVQSQNLLPELNHHMPLGRTQNVKVKCQQMLPNFQRIPAQPDAEADIQPMDFVRQCGLLPDQQIPRMNQRGNVILNAGLDPGARQHVLGQVKSQGLGILVVRLPDRPPSRPELAGVDYHNPLHPVADPVAEPSRISRRLDRDPVPLRQTGNKSPDLRWRKAKLVKTLRSLAVPATNGETVTMKIHPDVIHDASNKVHS